MMFKEGNIFKDCMEFFSKNCLTKKLQLFKKQKLKLKKLL